MKQFHSLYRKLANYPLTPYLDVWHARKTLKQGNDKLVATTLAQYADIPETTYLRRAWVKSLAKRGRWSRLDKVMAQFSWLRTRFPDLAMLSLWHTDQKVAALRLYSDRWKEGKTVPFNMVGLHQDWLRQGHPSRAERWIRIEHLARHGRWKHIRQVAKPFSIQQKKYLKYWRSVQKNPGKAFKHWPAAMAEIPAAMILSDGIHRMSRSDPGTAWKILKQRQQQLSPSGIQEDDLLKLQRHTALRAARQHLSEAAAWLAILPVSLQNEDTRGWRTRLYILQQDWRDVLEAIASMPETEQQQSRWVYWTARAAEGTGQPEAARSLFVKLASERGYYSFLSAEHVDQPFRFSATNLVASDKTMSRIEQLPAVRRAYEWLQMGKRNKAAREWQHALAGSSKQQWEAAAALASRWGWYDQVIRAAYKADKSDALSNRFPLAFEASVMKAAQKTGLKPAEIWSIIRQESAFNQQAASYVGARGLMQLMPRTARKIARKLGMGKSTPQLFSPDVNIRLGSTYLSEQKKRFGNLALAAAAYNAGPHRVSRWLARTPFNAPEAWVEAIPFNETRRYVQQVMAFVSVYEWRQHKASSSLMARLNEQVQTVSLVEIPSMTVP